MFGNSGETTVEKGSKIKHLARPRGADNPLISMGFFMQKVVDIFDTFRYYTQTETATTGDDYAIH
jgi:hypothetical protein